MAVFRLRLWETVCYLVILVIGVFGNAVVCVVILKSGPPHRKFYHVPFNLYLMSLAVVDFALAVVSAPSYVMSTSYYHAHPKGTNGTILCKTITGYLLCFWLAGTSVYLLVIISFERYSIQWYLYVVITLLHQYREVLLLVCASLLQCHLK